jgi:hypothetical protein
MTHECGKVADLIRSMQWGRRGPAALAVLVAVTLAAVALAPAPRAGAQSAERRVFAFDRLNRAYQMDESQMQPVEQGPVTIYLSSPRNALILKDHSVALTPLGDGTHDASIVLDFLGSGDLTADMVTDAGTSSRFDDLVIVPRQKIRIDGRVRFSRAEGGWDIRALRLPKVVRIDIQSRLVGNLVTMCGSMGVFLGLDCDSLDQSLSRVEVPMPEAGSVFFLPRAELTDQEARALEAFLGLS